MALTLDQLQLINIQYPHTLGQIKMLHDVLPPIYQNEIHIRALLQFGISAAIDLAIDLRTQYKYQKLMQKENETPKEVKGEEPNEDQQAKPEIGQCEPGKAYSVDDPEYIEGIKQSEFFSELHAAVQPVIEKFINALRGDKTNVPCIIVSAFDGKIIEGEGVDGAIFHVQVGDKDSMIGLSTQLLHADPGYSEIIVKSYSHYSLDRIRAGLVASVAEQNSPEPKKSRPDIN